MLRMWRLSAGWAMLSCSEAREMEPHWTMGDEIAELPQVHAGLSPAPRADAFTIAGRGREASARVHAIGAVAGWTELRQHRFRVLPQRRHGPEARQRAIVKRPRREIGDGAAGRVDRDGSGSAGGRRGPPSCSPARRAIRAASSRATRASRS